MLDNIGEHEPFMGMVIVVKRSIAIAASIRPAIEDPITPSREASTVAGPYIYFTVTLSRPKRLGLVCYVTNTFN